MTPQEDDDVEARIREFFEENLAAIQMERGYGLSPEVKATALQHVLLYWRRLRDVAEKVTDTEVRLNLPGQVTAKERKFGIEGVVDIVRDNDRTVMYDVKTYDANVIRMNPEACERQLNVYAFIWQKLRGQPLDEMAVISTAFPESVREAINSGDEARLKVELQKWDPIVRIPFDVSRVEETIQDLGRVVDLIEDGAFSGPDVARLQTRQPGRPVSFAVDVCTNCEARYSCDSYRAYARGSSRERGFSRYYSEAPTDVQSTDRVVSALDVAPAPEELEELG